MNKSGPVAEGRWLLRVSHPRGDVLCCLCSAYMDFLFHVVFIYSHVHSRVLPPPPTAPERALQFVWRLLIASLSVCVCVSEWRVCHVTLSTCDSWDRLQRSQQPPRFSITRTKRLIRVQVWSLEPNGHVNRPVVSRITGKWRICAPSKSDTLLSDYI